jgi:hypothetical protein
MFVLFVLKKPQGLTISMMVSTFNLIMASGVLAFLKRIGGDLIDSMRLYIAHLLERLLLGVRNLHESKE